MAEEKKPGIIATAVGVANELSDIVKEGLDKAAEYVPAVVGAVDGAYSVYSNKQPKRLESDSYKEGVGVGKVAGWLGAAALFFRGGLIRKTIGLYPVVTRTTDAAVNYLDTKLTEAVKEAEKKEAEAKAQPQAHAEPAPRAEPAVRPEEASGHTEKESLGYAGSRKSGRYAPRKPKA